MGRRKAEKTPVSGLFSDPDCRQASFALPPSAFSGRWPKYEVLRVHFTLEIADFGQGGPTII